MGKRYEANEMFEYYEKLAYERDKELMDQALEAQVKSGMPWEYKTCRR